MQGVKEVEKLNVPRGDVWTDPEESAAQRRGRSPLRTSVLSQNLLKGLKSRDAEGPGPSQGPGPLSTG